MFILAGGPGQASAETFNLGLKAAYWRAFFPGYTLVAYDDRGTGKSGALDCPTARTIADCGNAHPGPGLLHDPRARGGHRVGAARARRRQDRDLGRLVRDEARRVAYALAHPSHVERLLLDSVVLPDNNLVDPLSLRTIPASVNGICTNNVCPGIAPGMGDKLVALANQLEARPVNATVHFAPRLASFPVTIDGDTLVSLAYESDLSSAISSQLPAAINSALAGDYLPLERLVWMDAIFNVGDQGDVNIVLLLSTNCGDGPFPWGPNDPTDARRAALNAAVASLPPGAAGAFGTWALQSLSPFLCVDWPAPSGGAALGAGTAARRPGARAERRPRRPHADRVRREHGVALPAGPRPRRPGRRPLGAQPLGLRGERGALVARRRHPAEPVHEVLALHSAGRRLAQVGRGDSRRPRAFPASPAAPSPRVLQTIHDAEDYWLLLRHNTETFTGLVGGTLTPDANGAIRLVNFSSIPGLAITGNILVKIDPYGDPVVPLSVGYAQLTVGGRSAARGRISLSGNRLTGTLAKRKVAATF